MNIKYKLLVVGIMNDIIRLYNSLQPRHEIELEARVCFSYGKLVSNTNVYEFKAILNTMAARTPAIKYSETVECHEFGRRITRDAGTTVQKKDNVSTYIYTTPHRFLKIKWSLNTETPPTSADLGNLQCIRKKNVHIFKVHSNWNMFLVEAYSKINRLKTYEIEIERCTTDTFLTLNEIDMVNDLIYNLFKHRQDFKIVRQFNSLFTNKHMHTVFFPINKPINLKFDMWSTIKSNYYYYPKLDGERFLIYTDHHYLYIFNDTSQIHVKGNGGEFPMGCVMDCEGMEGGVYHVFDVLFWGGRDVRGENVGARYGYLEKSAGSFPPFIKLVNLYKTFDNTLWEIIQKFNTKSDGIIFTPRDEAYKNNCTYKYKPPELLTIDFMIDVDDKLYAMDNASDYILFKGSEEHPHVNSGDTITHFEYQLYDIVEFNYDYTLKNFKPIRVRHDKMRPNHISVALDVWYDIHHPIDIVSFVQNIS